MKKVFIDKVSLTCIASIIAVLVGGCIVISGCIVIGDCCKAKYEKKEVLRTPLESGSTVEVETSLGSINVAGADVNDCNVTANICIKAPSEEKAKEIAEQVKIRLVRDGKTLSIKTDKPMLKSNCCIGVSFNITVPRQTSIDCDTSYGSVKLADIEGNIKAETSYASIDCKNVSGQIKLETSYGSIDCTDIKPTAIEAESSFGSISINCSPSTTPDLAADVRTSYGNISFAVPPNFAGKINTSTSFGSVGISPPSTVKDTGNGKIHLKTSFGSIKVK